MDPAVSEAKFTREVETLRGLPHFCGGGWSLVSAAYPELVIELPHPSGVRRRFRLRCEDWDESPPSVATLGPDGGRVNEPEGSSWGNLSTGWGLCAPGTREYHAHHGENPWLNYRARTSLAVVITTIFDFYRRSRG